jgi:hypothetical protein
MSAFVKDQGLVAEKLAEIAEKNGGRLTPDLVLADARNPDSVLHKLFEWDDDVAAHQHRLFQARQIITSVRVVVTTEKRKISTVYYVRDPEAGSGEQGYVSIDKLKTSDDLARESIVMEFSRAEAHLQRARLHAEALGLDDQVQPLLDDLEKVKVAVKS